MKDLERVGLAVCLVVIWLLIWAVGVLHDRVDALEAAPCECQASEIKHPKVPDSFRDTLDLPEPRFPRGVVR